MDLIEIEPSNHLDILAETLSVFARKKCSIYVCIALECEHYGKPRWKLPHGKKCDSCNKRYRFFCAKCMVFVDSGGKSRHIVSEAHRKVLKVQLRNDSYFFNEIEWRCNWIWPSAFDIYSFTEEDFDLYLQTEYYKRIT